MLDNQTLERVSVAYRRGYNDGAGRTNVGAVVKPDYIKPFAEFDYERGFLAGANDALWEAYYAGRVLFSPIPCKEVA